MAINIGGSEPTDITYNGSAANYATLNGTVVWQRVSGTNGTAAYGSWVDFGSQTGGAITYGGYGSFGAWGPTTGTGPTNQEYVTITQSRSRSVTEYTSAIYQPQRRLCEEVTAPTGGGSAGVCSNPYNAIGGYDSSGSRLVSAASSTSVSPTSSNGGIEYRSQSVPNSSYQDWSTGNYWNQGVITITPQGVITVPGSPGTAVVSGQSPTGANTGSAARPVTFTYSVANPDTSVYGGGAFQQSQLTIYQEVQAATTGTITTADLVLDNGANSGSFGFTVNGSWNTIGTSPMDAVHAGSGDRTSISWSIPAQANGSPARSGTIQLRSGTGSTVLDTITWTQAAGPAVYTHYLDKAGTQNAACNGSGVQNTLYSDSNNNPISSNNPIYTDSALTTAASSGWYSDQTSVGYWNGSSWSNTGLCGMGGGL